MEKNSANTGVGEEDTIDPEHYLHFINAFEMPRWHFSHERQVFERYGHMPKLSGAIFPQNLGPQGNLVLPAHQSLEPCSYETDTT